MVWQRAVARRHRAGHGVAAPRGPDPGLVEAAALTVHPGDRVQLARLALRVAARIVHDDGPLGQVDPLVPEAPGPQVVTQRGGERGDGRPEPHRGLGAAAAGVEAPAGQREDVLELDVDCLVASL